MNKPFAPLFLMMIKPLLLCTALIITFNVNATNFYVATNGNDVSNSGTSLSSPYLTIQKASSVALSGDFVYVRAGVYRERVDIVSNGVTYQPYNGESVTINGTNLMLSWTLTSGSTYQTTMNWDMDVWGTNQVFADGKMIELARWPDQTSADIVLPTNAKADAVAASGNNFIITDADFNEPGARWVGAKIWVNLAHNGYDGQGWTGTVLSTSGNTITVNFNEPPRLGDQPWGLGATTEYFLFDPTATGVNATGGINALLSNGEWWKSGTILYVKTPNSAAPSSTISGTNLIEAKRRHFAFIPSVTNKSNYTIKGFNLFACSITTDLNAISNRSIAEDAQNITIDGINAKYPSHQTDMTGNWQDQHYAWSGIVVSGRNNTIKNSTIQYAATSALSIQGFGIKILNNTIQDANYMCSNAGAFNTGFVCQDAEIANNTIFNTTMMAINFKYSQNSNINNRDVYRIHHNTIYNFMRRSGDSGGIDAALLDGKWIRIDHNIIYTNTPVIGTMVHGIYLDYGGNPPLNDEGHFTIDHNVIYNIPAPLLINNIKDVNIFNNVLLSVGIPRPIEGAAIGTNFKIYNNIMDKVLSIRSDNLIVADLKANIFNAYGPNLTTLFVDPVAGNYNLASTAVKAINAGITTGAYDETPLTGLPDLGAYESTFTSSPPVVPTISSVTSNAASDWAEPPFNAADGNSYTKWSQPTQSGYWRIQYSTSEVMNGYEIISTNDDNGLRDLKTWTIQGSNDGSNWTILDTRTNQTWSAPNTTNYYSFSNSNSYSYYQVAFTANNGSGYTQVAEITFLNNPLDPTYPIITARGENLPSEGKEKAFDLNNTTKWLDYSATSFLQIQYQFANTFNQYVIVSGNDVPDRDPLSWTIQASNNGISWTTLDSRTNQSWASRNLAKTFTLNNTVAYTYYRMNITAVTSGNIVQLSELTYGAATSDTQAPTVPTNLVASGVSTTGFTVNWNSAADNVGVTGYEVFRNGVSAGTTTAANYSFTGLAAGAAYNVAVRAYDAALNYSAQTASISVTTTSAGLSTGTGYYWRNMTSVTSNATRTAATGINDNNLVTDVVVPDNSTANQWQGAGITWSTAKSNINKIEYYSGTQFNNGTDNGCFTAGIQLQYSTNGTAWTNASGWSISPAYPYNTSSSNQVYTFTGAALPNTCRGVRIVGQVYTNNISWAIKVKEVRVYNSSNVLQRTANNSDANSSTNPSVTLYPNPVALGVFNLRLPKESIYKQVTVVVRDLTGKTVLQNRFVSNGNIQRVDAGKLIAGTYFVTVVCDKFKSAGKMVVMPY